MSLSALLVERARRQQQAAQVAEVREGYASIAADLRAWYYPEQSAFFSSPAKRKATIKTRRAGLTSGGCHEFLARALEQPGWRGVYGNEVREEAKRLAWRADTKQGMIDIIEQLAADGRLRLGHDRRDFAKGADVKVDEQALTIDFRNGSQIRVFAADDLRAQERGRGAAPHVLWGDEAQKMPHLRNLVDAVFGPSMTDHDGEIWLTGTPSEWIDGYFHDVTQEEIEMRVKGWEVHTLLVTMNPFYGATPEERWARTAGAELERNGWDVNNPPASFRREWLAQWVKEDARFVYSVHRWPQATLEYAETRTTSITPDWLKKVNPEGKDPSGISGYTDRWYDHEASLRDLPKVLPGTTDAIDWFFGLGGDFGYNPHPFAVTLWAVSPMWPDIFEMFSWKRTLVLPDYQRDCIRWFFDNVRALLYLDGDPGGLQGAHMDGWRELFQIPIEDAEKTAKRTWQEMYNNDGERGRIHFRKGSVLLHEQRHLTYVLRGRKLEESQDRKLADGTTPGSDCSDGGLYAYRRYINRRTEEPKPPPVQGSAEWYAEEERKMREAARQGAREAIEAAEADDYDGYYFGK